MKSNNKAFLCGLSALTLAGSVAVPPLSLAQQMQDPNALNPKAEMQAVKDMLTRRIDFIDRVAEKSYRSREKDLCFSFSLVVEDPASGRQFIPWLMVDNRPVGMLPISIIEAPKHGSSAGDLLGMDCSANGLSNSETQIANYAKDLDTMMNAAIAKAPLPLRVGLALQLLPSEPS